MRRKRNKHKKTLVLTKQKIEDRVKKSLNNGNVVIDNKVIRVKQTKKKFRKNQGDKDECLNNILKRYGVNNIKHILSDYKNDRKSNEKVVSVLTSTKIKKK